MCPSNNADNDCNLSDNGRIDNSNNHSTSNPFAGVIFYQDQNNGDWVGQMPAGIARDDVEAALLLLMLRYSQPALGYSIFVNNSGRLTTTMTLPAGTDPNALLVQTSQTTAQLTATMTLPAGIDSNMLPAQTSQTTPVQHVNDVTANRSELPVTTGSCYSSDNWPRISHFFDEDSDTVGSSTTFPTSSTQTPVDAGATGTNNSLTTGDVTRLLADPVIRDDPRRVITNLNARQIRLVTTVYNAIRPSGDLINAIAFLEADGWIPALAIQSWRRFQHRSTLLAQQPNTENERIDRFPAKAGALFDKKKLTLSVKKNGNPHHKTYTYDEKKYGQFNPDNLSDLLRLNRQRSTFLDSHVGIQPTTARGFDTWHPLEKWDISERYLRRDRHATADFPNYKGITSDHNAAFKDFPLPGWGIVAKQRDNVEGDIHRWWIAGQPGRGMAKHKAAQAEVKEEHERLRAEAMRAYAESERFDEGLEALERDEEEARLEAEAETEMGKVKGKKRKAGEMEDGEDEGEGDGDGEGKGDGDDEP